MILFVSHLFAALPMHEIHVYLFLWALNAGTTNVTKNVLCYHPGATMKVFYNVALHSQNKLDIMTFGNYMI